MFLFTVFPIICAENVKKQTHNSLCKRIWRPLLASYWEHSHLVLEWLTVRWAGCLLLATCLHDGGSRGLMCFGDEPSHGLYTTMLLSSLTSGQLKKKKKSYVTEIFLFISVHLVYQCIGSFFSQCEFLPKGVKCTCVHVWDVLLERWQLRSCEPSPYLLLERTPTEREARALTASDSSQSRLCAAR